MDVKHYKDAGFQFKEIICRRYQVLHSLAKEYLKRGARVWLVPFDKCAGTWILTVRELA